jgi:uncharacterized membrane protein
MRGAQPGGGGMMEIVVSLTAGAAVLGCGMVAGLFLTFSDFVMPALLRAGPAAGVTAMTTINRTIFRSWTIVLLRGVLLLTGGTAVAMVLIGKPDAASWLAAAALLYGGGVIGVTVVRNIPLNDRLQALADIGPEAAAFWPRYVARWTPWNSIRAVAALAAAACALCGLLLMAG